MPESSGPLVCSFESRRADEMWVLMNVRKNLLIATKGVDLLSGEPTGVDCRPIHEPSDDLVVLELVRGRRLLVNLTGEDFGFDLAK
jgi:hypothetical protein